MVETRRLTELVSGALQRLELPEGPVTVALSGGADSAALAYLMVAGSIESRCLHVDHGFPASPMLARAAMAVADHLDLELQTVEVTVPSGPSPEAQARSARYEAIASVEGPVLTAHTRDDNAETVLINLVRGTGSRGLAGIPSFRAPNVHRPMLGISRAETREMAGLAGLPFVDDPMNADEGLARARVRRTVLPLLAEMNPQIVESLSRAGGLVGRDADFIDSLLSETPEGAVAVGLVKTLPRPLADRLLARLLDGVGVGVTSDRLDRVWEVVRGESQRRDLAEGKCVVRSGALIVVE